jgi:hypothetical protein
MAALLFKISAGHIYGISHPGAITSQKLSFDQRYLSSSE